VYVTLSGLVVDQCGTITSAEPIESESLGIIQNGKGKIDLSIDVSRLDATVTKSGALRISGTADRAIIMNTGPGEFDGADLEVSDCHTKFPSLSGVVEVEFLWFALRQRFFDL
jgi:hypothetical protein